MVFKWCLNGVEAASLVTKPPSPLTMATTIPHQPPGPLSFPTSPSKFTVFMMLSARPWRAEVMGKGPGGLGVARFIIMAMAEWLEAMDQIL